MKRMKQIIALLIISVLLLNGAASADFSSLQEAVDYYEEYMQDFCDSSEGWHYVDMRTSLESDGKLIYFTIVREGFYEDLISNGVNGDLANRTMKQVDSMTLEMRQTLAGFGCSAGISLLKGIDEDAVLYLSFNGTELTQDEPEYSYSGLVNILRAPENISVSEMKAYFERELSSFCSTHDEWTYDGVVEGNNGQIIAFRLCRAGFMEEINQYGTRSKLVRETVAICDDFSYMLSEAFHQYQAIITSIFLDADTKDGVVYISANGSERESSETYRTLTERFGTGETVSDNTSGSSSSFTNKYGTPTTKCAHAGCNNYIATTGDTNCCPSHSSRCLNCGKYIDEDAMYCIDCISNSVSHSAGSGNSGYGQPNNYDMPKEDESLSDYIKRVDPSLYQALQDQYDTAVKNGW